MQWLREHRPIPELSKEEVNLFWSQVKIQDSGCWEWQGGCNPGGYGQVCYKKTFLAHRVAYSIYYQVWDIKLKVLHTCDNPPCVNPFHLFLGTQAVNMTDKATKGRAIYNHAQRKASKLTKEQVREIRAKQAPGKAIELAKAYKVTASNIHAIWARRIWKELE